MARTPTSGVIATAISPEEYANFIDQIELQTIWLSETRIRNHCGPEAPERNSIRINSGARWESTLSGFRAFCQYRVRFKSEDTPSLDLDVTYGLDFSSSDPMTDDIFAIFREVNLPVNTWPYLREFVSTTMGRMSWAPFTLPAFKTSTGRASQRGSTRKASSRTGVQPPNSK